VPSLSSKSGLSAWIGTALMVSFGALTFAQDASEPATQAYAAVQDLQVVDCLLPGQVRVVGGRTYLTPRRPTRTTAADCRNRGGEYLAYDRADYRSALNVWLATAEQGDPQAQTNVGEIFERGIGAEPNYEAAADWYKKAADQGFQRAQFNLGTLFEQGLGVPQNRIEALNWYRRASGLSEDSLLFRSAADEEQAELRAQLEAQIEQEGRQIQILTRQVDSLQDELARQTRGTVEVSAELEAVRALLAQLGSARSSGQARLAGLEPARPPRTENAGTFHDRENRTYRQRDFGRFYAHVIGIDEYDNLDRLPSALNDVQRAKQVLEERYGFSVLSLQNPSHLGLMSAVNDLNERLGEDDNLLIYFAGRGDRLKSGPRETGYWLPVNADRPPNDTLWVPNEFITRHLGRIKARRVLVVSDSLYSDLLASEPGLLMVGEGRYDDSYIAYKLPKRSRLLLASGADQPVLDESGSMYSVFARALFEELESNDQVLTAPELYLKVRERMLGSPASSPGAGEPELKTIKAAGHEVGDFFFVPS
jgi:hypothetical protein